MGVALTSEGFCLLKEATLHLSAGILGSRPNGCPSQTGEEVGHGRHLVAKLLHLTLGCCSQWEDCFIDVGGHLKHLLLETLVGGKERQTEGGWMHGGRE